MSGFTAMAPAMKPASNFLMRSISTPPTKPTLPVVLVSAAAAPTRNDPCSSANTRLATFGKSVSSARVVGRAVVVPHDRVDDARSACRGWRSAPAASASLHRNPTPMTSWLPSPTSRFRRSARSASPVGVDSLGMTPNSSMAWSRPAAAASLNDLSPRPVMSNSRPIVAPSAAGWRRAARGPRCRPVAWCRRRSCRPGASVPSRCRCGRRVAGCLGLGRRLFVVVATCCGREAERGDERGCKHALALDHVSPFSGWIVGWVSLFTGTVAEPTARYMPRPQRPPAP